MILKKCNFCGIMFSGRKDAVTCGAKNCVRLRKKAYIKEYMKIYYPKNRLKILQQIKERRNIPK